MKTPVHNIKDFVVHADGYINPHWSHNSARGWLGSGVKDKNDREIFEGDIVKDKDGDILTVQFKRGCFCIAEEPLDVDFSTGVGIAVDIEVIGHIAEGDQ